MAWVTPVSILLFISILGLLTAALPITIPPGLRRAKAVGETEPPIIPQVVTSTESDNESAEKEKEKTVITPSLRQRARAYASRSTTTLSSLDFEKMDFAAKPLILTKKKRTTKVPSPTTASISPEPETTTESVTEETTTRPKPKAVPKGSNYGVNTLVQTNLIDSKGKVLKGVKRVVLPAPHIDSKSVKNSRATAKVVEGEAEQVLPIRFGQARPQVHLVA